MRALGVTCKQEGEQQVERRADAIITVHHSAGSFLSSQTIVNGITAFSRLLL